MQATSWATRRALQSAPASSSLPTGCGAKGATGPEREAFARDRARPDAPGTPFSLTFDERTRAGLFVRERSLARHQPIHLHHFAALNLLDVPGRAARQVGHRILIEEVEASGLDHDVADAPGMAGASAAHQRLGQV